MKTIKSIIAIAALLVGAGTARAALDFPSVPTYSPGKNASLSVVANTPDGTSAIQFTLNLPDAFSIYDTTLEIDKTMAPDHLCRVNKVSDSSYRCVIYSNSNTPFASDTGKLFSINLKADPTAPKGDYTLSFTEIRSSDASGEETTMPDASVSLVVIIPAKSVSISPSPTDISVGEAAKLTASVLPAEASQIVRWSSSDPATTTVSDDGTVTGIAPGTAVITATTADGTNLSAQCNVNVRPVLVTSITVTPSGLVLHPGETGTLTAAVLPENAGNRSVEWTSGNPSVATVNADGLVEAKAVGTAVITATATDGSGVSAECAVSVTAPLAESIVLDHDRLDMKVGECVTVKASVTPAGALQEVEWICDNTEIISVDNDGLVTALSPGYTVITASVKDDSGLQAYCEVYVEEESGIDGVETESIPVINTLTSEIVVTGIPDDEIIRIITPSGSMVYCGTGHRISGLAPELYIVIVRAHAYKVYVR